jgi:hypothetical protein
MHGHGKEALEHFERMCEESVQPEKSLFFVFCQLVAMEVGGSRHTLLCFNDHSLYDFSKIVTLHVHAQPSWLCWPSTGCREHDQGNVL